jgi:hypothetical protein
MSPTSTRRAMLKQAGLGLALGAAALPAAGAEAGTGRSLLPRGAARLRELTQRLARMSRRRDFRSVPMILSEREQWDAAALDEIIAYRGPRQVWDNTEIGGNWLNLMRNALNTQIWSFKDPEFLCLSATHGSAHLALFDAGIWDKYRLPRLAGAGFAANSLIAGSAGGRSDPADFEAPHGAFSAEDNSIETLQHRGAVFLACHNAIWEIAGRLRQIGVNPDSLSQDALAAELTNHLVAGVVLTPGIAGTLAQLQRAGFDYGRS